MIGADGIEIRIVGLIIGLLLGHEESGSLERFYLVQGSRDQFFFYN